MDRETRRQPAPHSARTPAQRVPGDRGGARGRRAAFADLQRTRGNRAVVQLMDRPEASTHAESSAAGATQAPPGSKVETSTRLGFEIEPGSHLYVKSDDGKDRAERLANKTLATSGDLEFVIDDITEETRQGTTRTIAQIEFRSVPLSRKRAANMPDVRKAAVAAIESFPLNAFGKSGQEFKTIVEGKGWKLKPEYENEVMSLAPLLTKSAAANKISTGPRLVQHVTHSVPLSSYVKLGKVDRKKLIPGSEEARDVEGLLTFFLDKLKGKMVKEDTIKVTTRARNEITPNIKSGLDTIAGLLPRDRFEKFKPTITPPNAPSKVTVGDETGEIGTPEYHENLPSFPAFNVHDGPTGEGKKAHLSGEEKLQPVLFDKKRKDIRVLVEHRSDQLVDAVVNAMSKNTVELNSFLKIFEKLDNVEGDETFHRWFTSPGSAQAEGEQAGQ